MVALAMLLPGGHAWAGEPWSIATRTGSVQVIKPGAQPISVTSVERIEAGDGLVTGPDGRLVLVRGAQTIVVAPNSRMSLPADEGKGLGVRVLQQLGTLLFKVERREAPYFEVETPFLAAIVKGTTFTVRVDALGAAVHVVEGAVQVDARGSNRSTLVGPGQTARVSGDGRGTLSVEGGTAGERRAEGTTEQEADGTAEQDASAPQGAEPSAATGPGGGGGADPAQTSALIIEAPLVTEIEISLASDGLVRMDGQV
ncbi:MAG: FecR domain-containing protein, partial [Deltaproteobacteria bacterium]|nr:FecR domain-containing protein [Deltaproteobacteria bacterium]